MKIALLETIEALVSAIKSKFLTKTEAESIYQPKASAINTSNIGSQSVSYASRANYSLSASDAYALYGGAAISSGKDFPSEGTYSMKYFLAKGSETDITGLPPVNASVIHMGAYIDSSCDHQLALGNDGELYTRYIRNSAWQSWTRMAKASEIPSVSGFATEDWVTSNYYNLQEMDEHYYTMDDVDSMLGDFLKKTGGTMTGMLTTKDIVLQNGAIYAGSTSNYIIRYDTDSNGNQTHTFGGGAKRVHLGDWFYVDRYVCHCNVNMELNKRLTVGGIDLTFDTSTNTLNFSGNDGQTVHIAVNGNVIA
jgi:hypothetical protein|nr:MAG TPA_asm: hypothetical protein [Caudoviricetes sp.]